MGGPVIQARTLLVICLCDGSLPDSEPKEIRLCEVSQGIVLKGAPTSPAARDLSKSPFRRRARQDTETPRGSRFMLHGEMGVGAKRSVPFAQSLGRLTLVPEGQYSLQRSPSLRHGPNASILDGSKYLIQIYNAKVYPTLQRKLRPAEAYRMQRTHRSLKKTWYTEDATQPKTRNAGLDIPCLAVGGARLDRLASLLDLLENGIVAERVYGDDLGGLSVQGHVVGLDTWKTVSLNSHDDGGMYAPSSFFSTRSTAPEQPPQLMATSNL